MFKNETERAFVLVMLIVRVRAALDDGERRRVRGLTTNPVGGEVLGSASIRKEIIRKTDYNNG